MKLFPHRSSPSNVPRRRLELDDSQSASSVGRDQRSFMRNRTITGTISLDKEEPSSRAQVHSLAAHRRKVGGIFALILGAIVLLSLILLQFTAQVTVSISSTGISRPVDTAIYEEAINQYLDNHPVERLRFALSPSQLIAYLDTVYPEIESANQRTLWGIGKTNFQLTLRKPVAGWQLNGKQYFVDESGIAYENNYFDSPKVNIVDESGVDLQTGSTVTSTRFLAFVGKIVAMGQERGYTVTEAKLPSGTTREIAVHVEGVRTEFRLSIDRGAGEQVEDMDRALKYLTSKGVAPDYIDLRIAGRAYYQ